MSDPVAEIRDAARAALPPLDGEVAVPGLESQVEVLRDRWGIPSLSAESLEDLWFAQGFVQASERLFQIELVLRTATGRLSEWFSELTVPADRFARTVGFHRIGRLEAERWTDRSRSMMGRFVDGARAWVEAMPAPPIEYSLLGIAPDLPRDLGSWAAAFAYVAWGLSGNWDRELLRRRLQERGGSEAVRTWLPPGTPNELDLPAGSLDGALLDGVPRSAGRGSNNWVVAGSRTSTGSPLLANDPHLLAQQPAPWFELHMRAPGYEARGVAFPFAPGVVIGTTAHHAWGFTNVSGDVQDLYVERLNEDGTASAFEGSWEPLAVHPERIEIRGGAPIELSVRETRHGPILDTVPMGVAGHDFDPLEGTLALRWTAQDGLVEPAVFVDVVRAASFDEFRRAVDGLACPGQNVLYADVGGMIGYQCTGRYPIRRSGDGSAPVPGWTPEHEWDGYVPFDELPWSQHPGSGFVVTANNRVHDEDYPHLIGLDVHAPYRARRIADLLRENDDLTLEDCGAIQVDTVSLPARRLLPSMTAALDEAKHVSQAAREAIARLRAWDGDVAAGSWEAAVYQTWVGAVASALFAEDDDPEAFAAYFASREPFVCWALPTMLESGRPPPVGGSWSEVLGQALETALRALERRLGEDASTWRWGTLHRVRFAHPLARLPGLDEMFVAAEQELGGDEQTVLQAGIDARLGFEAVVVPSWRFVADLADLDRSAAVLTTGQSGHPASPHWSDQARLWAAGDLRPCPFSRPAVEAAAERSLTLHPG